MFTQYVLCDIRWKGKSMDNDALTRLTTRIGAKSPNIRYIIMALQRPDQFEPALLVAKSSYTKYYAIIHDKDEGKTPHIHLVLYDKSGTTLKKHQERFEHVCPSNMLEIPNSPRACIRYLIHLDDPQKAQYDRSAVMTNDPIGFSQALDDLMDCSVQYDDYVKVSKKEMTPSEYIQKYKGEFSRMSFYQKNATYDKLIRIFGNN